MTGCFTTILFLVAAVMTMVSIIRWFEQATEAVEFGWWNKVFLLLACPPVVWLFPSRVAAGRPTPVPRHVPVRGFGSAPIAPPVSVEQESEAPRANIARSDEPPPGTPKEFLGMPVIPKKKPGANRGAVDPEKLAKLREKMREQGMLEENPKDQNPKSE
jgi:hypothetical protein